MTNRRITKRLVDGLQPKTGEYTVWDDQLLGFGVRVRATGAMSYVVGYRAGSGRLAPKKRLTIGAVGKITPDEARRVAQSHLGAVAHGRDPAEERRKAEAAAGNTLRRVVENYLARGAYDRQKRKLRTIEAQRAAFERLVFPQLGARQIGEIKRSEISRLLDKIEDERGPRMASLTLALMSRVMSWHASRGDDFRSPIVRGMSKDRGGATSRDRVLTNEELRAFWRAAEGWEHPFTRLLRFILLTATRREEAAGMRWEELDGTTWTIPAARYKTKLDLELPLSGAAWQVLATSPMLTELRRAAAKRGADPDRARPKEGFVFTTSGETAIGGFSKFKARFDLLMLTELRKAAAERGEAAKVVLDRWTIHDLRRTARSLITQAGVPPDHAERALGHVIGGVRGVYDRHRYYEEKRQAFEALATQVERVLHPQPNVVPMRRGTGNAAP
jgi:integrase